MKTKIFLVLLCFASTQMFAARPEGSAPVKRPTSITVTKSVSLYHVGSVSYTATIYYSKDAGTSWTAFSGSSITILTTDNVLYKVDFTATQPSLHTDYHLDNGNSGVNAYAIQLSAYTLTMDVSRTSEANYTIGVSAIPEDI